MAVSATIAMTKKARELREQGKDIISLSIGEPDFKTPPHIADAAKEAINSGDYFGYPPVAGYLDLREAVAEKLKTQNNLNWSANNIVVSTGAKQSIANVMLSLVNPGDEVVVLAPYWVTYSEIVKLAEGVPVILNGQHENDYKPTAEEIKGAITPKTKLIIYSSPCNPTGSLYSRQEFEEIATVLRDFPDILVVADEIYEHINFVGEHVSMGSIEGMHDRTITINGMSKAFAMTGWRIGYMAAADWIAKACDKMQGQFTSGASSISQRAALAALKADLAPTKEMTAAYKHRRDVVYDLIAEIPGVKNYVPQGAFYFFPDFSYYFGKSFNGNPINDANDLAMYLLEEAGVSTVTGQAFGAPSNIRISYAASEEELREAIRRIKEALAKLQ